VAYLRRIPTRRLLLLCAAVAVLGASVTAIALAATSGGPVPPPKPLAQAVHDSLTAPAVPGISARISFTNHLVDSSLLPEGSDPLLAGASGRLWAAGDRLRVELQSDGGAGDSQILLNGRALSVYDASAGTVYRATLPPDRRRSQDAGVPSLARVQDALAHLMRHADLSAAQPGDVGGRPAYTVRLTPKRDGGLVGAAELAWDAEHGEPLRAAVYAAGVADPVLEITASDVSIGRVDDSVFAVAPPAGTKVVDLSAHGRQAAGGERQAGHGAPVTGLSAVQAKVPFAIAAPQTLAGRARSDVRLAGSERDPAALVTYGHGLAGIAVLESAAPAAQASARRGGDRAQLDLPRVAIGASSGQELATALGTLVRFERAGVAYTVLGSVPPAVAEAAARGLR
jgi:outer membrane lipoprotein-sorting protein